VKSFEGWRVELDEVVFGLVEQASLRPEGSWRGYACAAQTNKHHNSNSTKQEERTK